MRLDLQFASKPEDRWSLEVIPEPTECKRGICKIGLTVDLVDLLMDWTGMEHEGECER